MRESLDGFDETLHRLGGARLVRTEPRVIRLPRFRIVGVREQDDAAVEDLAGVEGFDEDIATELQRRGREFIEKRDADLAARLAELGLSEEVRETEGLTLPMLVALGEKGVKTRDDLADLASDELREIVGESFMDADQANDIIMKARAHWFADEAPPAEEAKA